jgi:hypothetical protein
MAEQASLGALKRLDVRNIWPNEAADFTPWLAKEENISRLGEALGLELEVEQTEVAVGPYSADILARDSAGDHVVIENQLLKTDHDHLGKALTYAAVLGAHTVVWVASAFTDEHRKTLDWLNDNTGDDLSFFGVQVELWSIDDSRPAIRFSVVSRPADIVRQASISKAGELSESRKLQLEWWTAFRDALLARQVVTSARSPRPRYWYDVPLGRAGMHLSLIASPDEGRIGVRLYLRNKVGGQRALAELLRERDAIERDIGSPLQWDANPSAVDKTVALVRPAELCKKDKWPEYLEWMVDTTRRFHAAFAPRLHDLDLSAAEAPES